MTVMDGLQKVVMMTMFVAHDIIGIRRKSWIDFAAPKAAFLLEEPEVFSPDSITQHLFGNRFWDALSEAVTRNNSLL